MSEDNSEPTMDPVPNGFKIDEVKLTKLSLQPGEILALRIYSDTVTESALSALRRQLTPLFPNNKILLFSMPHGDKMEMNVISVPDAGASEEVGSCAAPTSYCNDCHCGKKERIERKAK